MVCSHKTVTPCHTHPAHRQLAEILELALQDPQALEQREAVVGDAIGPWDHLPLSGQATTILRTSTSSTRGRGSNAAPPNRSYRGGKGGYGDQRQQQQQQQHTASQAPGEPDLVTRTMRGRRRETGAQYKRAGREDGRGGQQI
jgi:hypothetical protein